MRRPLPRSSPCQPSTRPTRTSPSATSSRRCGAGSTPRPPWSGCSNCTGRTRRACSDTNPTNFEIKDVLSILPKPLRPASLGFLRLFVPHAAHAEALLSEAVVKLIIRDAPSPNVAQAGQKLFLHVHHMHNGRPSMLVLFARAAPVLLPTLAPHARSADHPHLAGEAHGADDRLLPGVPKARAGGALHQGRWRLRRGGALPAVHRGRARDDAVLLRALELHPVRRASVRAAPRVAWRADLPLCAAEQHMRLMPSPRTSTSLSLPPFAKVRGRICSWA